MMGKETFVLHTIGVPALTSKRLELRRIESKDAASIVDISVYDGFFAKDEEDVLRILDMIDSDIDRGESVHWGIFLKSTNEIAGNCGFYRGYPDNVGEIGYILKAAYRGLGIMTEAVELVVDYGLHKMHLNNVIACINPVNLKSMAVVQRAGFHQVEILPDTIKFAKLLP